jgi:hypothetical protein
MWRSGCVTGDAERGEYRDTGCRGAVPLPYSFQDSNTYLKTQPNHYCHAFAYRHLDADKHTHVDPNEHTHVDANCHPLAVTYFN